MKSSEYKILIIAEAANPEWVSVPLVGWSISKALQNHSPKSVIVTQVRNRDAWLRAGEKENIDFVTIDSEKAAKVTHKISSIIRGKSGNAWTIDTAFAALSYYYFEYLVWKRFGAAIQKGEFDIVHRVTPLSPSVPSTLANKCAKAGTPFIVGPLNGGVPWPKEFSQLMRQESEWLTYIRSAYKLLPGYKSTLKHSAALIAGSQYTLGELPDEFKDKSFYLPENGIDLNRFQLSDKKHRNKPLKMCFVGRVVPVKEPKLLLEASLPFLKNGDLLIEFIGDGPLLPELKDFARHHQISSEITFHGWVQHQNVQEIMAQCDLLGFTSIKDFGGGVILEAMTLGVVPIVVDYAGPGDLVDSQIGYKIPIGQRNQMVEKLTKILEEIKNDPSVLDQLSNNCINRIAEKFTWEKKATQIHSIYDWTLSKQPTPKPSPFD